MGVLVFITDPSFFLFMYDILFSPISLFILCMFIFSVSLVLLSLWMMCYGILQSNPRGEMFASISSSLMERFRFDSSVSADSSFQVRLALLFSVRIFLLFMHTFPN